MNKKTTFSALTLFISASISLIAVGLIKNQSLYASNVYSRTFTFDKKTPLEFIDEDGIYYFSGEIDVDKNNNRYIAYDIYGYGAFDLRARVKDNAAIEEIVEVNNIGTTEYTFDSTKGFDVLYINAYCYNELII